MIQLPEHVPDQVQRACDEDRDPAALLPLGAAGVPTPLERRREGGGDCHSTAPLLLLLLLMRRRGGACVSRNTIHMNGVSSLKVGVTEVHQVDHR